MGTRARVLTLALALLLPAYSTGAADKWIGIRSTDILIIGNASDAQIRRTAETFAQLREALSALLPGKLQPSSVSTTAIVFKNDAAQRPFKPANASGVFQPASDVNYISLNGEIDLPASILREYVRQTMRDIAGAANLPLWFSEGISDYFSTLEGNTRDRKYVLGRSVPDYLQRLNKEQMLPLETLFSVNRDSPQYSDKDKQPLFRAQSWALVHFLMQADGAKHQKQLADFVDAAAAGKAPLECFQTAFQMDVSGAQRELERYVHVQSALPTTTAAMKSDADFQHETEVFAVSEAESEFYLGDMQFHTNHLPEAEDLLKKSIIADPNLGGPAAALGMLRMKQRKYGEAVDLLKKAVALDSKNPLVHYDYAYLLQQQIQDTGEITAESVQTAGREFRRAIELAPRFVQSYEMLAYFNLVQNEDIPETIQLVRKAREYSPGRDNLSLMLAQLDMHEKQFAEARTLLTSLTNSTSAEPATRHTAANLLEDLANLEAVQRDRERREQESGKSQTVELAPDSAAPTEINLDPLGNGPKTGMGVVEEITPARPKVQGERVTGLLTLVDCRNGLTLTVKTDKGDVKLHSDSPGEIKFVSYTEAVSAEIQCGPAKAPGISVAVTYKPIAGSDSIGEPLMVEFLAKF